MKAATILCLLIGAQAAFGQLFPPQPEQVWKSKQGTSLKAKLRGIDAGNVIFESADGTTRQVPLDALADEDRQRVASLIPRLLTDTLENSSALEGTWPARVSTNLDTANVRPSAGARAGQGFTSSFFEVTSDTELTQATANEFIQILESAHALMRTAPWGVLVTVPKGQKLQVKLCDRPAKIPSTAAADAGAYYERETRTLHVTLDAAGLHYAGANLVLNTNWHPRAMMRELAKMLISDVENNAPGWFVIGFPSYFERIPFRAGTFWTGIAERSIAEEVRATGKAPGTLAGTLSMTNEHWNGGSRPSPSSPPTAIDPVPAQPAFVPPSAISRTPGMAPSTPVPPFSLKVPASALESATHDAFLLCLHFAMHEPERLGKFLKAVQKDKAAWDAYFAGVDQYRKDIAAFLQRPEVEKLPDGAFRYPSSLTPPKAPKPPHDVEASQVPFVHQSLLLDGRTLDQTAEDAMKTLRNARIGG